MKEGIITNIISNLIDKIGVENCKIVREILYSELYDFEIIKTKNELIVYEDEIGNILKKFLAIKKLQGCTDRTIKAYYSELIYFFNSINKNVDDITTDDIRVYLAKNKKSCSNTTLDNKRRYLNTFFEWCLDEEIVKKSPLRRMEKIKSIKKVKEAFTEIEIEKMRNQLIFRKERIVLNQSEYYKEIKKLRNIAIFETLLSTGVRVAELVSIDTDDVNLETGEIVVLGKGNKERIVYLNARAKIALFNYINKRKDNLECLFISCNPQTGEFSRLDISGVELMIRKLGKDLEIDAYPHKFRRTTATSAANKGMPIEQVQKMLGHASLNTTQIYVNVQTKAVKDSHEKYFN